MPVESLAIGQLNGQDVLVSGSWDAAVRIWGADGKPLLNLTDHAADVWAVAIGRLNDEDVVVSGGRDGVILWNGEGVPIGTLTTNEVNAIAVGRFNRQDVIATGGKDIRIWTRGV